MAEFTLRKAQKADQRPIRRLIYQVGINPMALDWQRFIVAEDKDGNFIGCGQVKPHNDGSFELASIAVVPDWQGRGVARAIIESLIDERPAELFLTCRPYLETFYQQFGFAEASSSEVSPYFRRLLRMGEFLRKIGLLRKGFLVMQRGGRPTAN